MENHPEIPPNNLLIISVFLPYSHNFINLSRVYGKYTGLTNKEKRRQQQQQEYIPQTPLLNKINKFLNFRKKGKH